MFNSPLPSASELPSSRQLVRSSVIAFAVAMGLLVTVVMPSEHAFTGLFRWKGHSPRPDSLLINIHAPDSVVIGASNPALVGIKKWDDEELARSFATRKRVSATYH